jgi:hypothetical protein
VIYFQDEIIKQDFQFEYSLNKLHNFKGKLINNQETTINKVNIKILNNLLSY